MCCRYGDPVRSQLDVESEKKVRLAHKAGYVENGGTDAKKKIETAETTPGS